MSDLDAVTPQFWTPESLHAYLAIYRGEDGVDPGWWVFWDYATWTFFLVEGFQWDWDEHPGGVRGLCPLGTLDTPLPDVPYLTGEPLVWAVPTQYVQLEMDL